MAQVEYIRDPMCISSGPRQWHGTGMPRGHGYFYRVHSRGIRRSPPLFVFPRLDRPSAFFAFPVTFVGGNREKVTSRLMYLLFRFKKYVYSEFLKNISDLQMSVSVDYRLFRL